MPQVFRIMTLQVDHNTRVPSLRYVNGKLALVWVDSLNVLGTAIVRGNMITLNPDEGTVHSIQGTVVEVMYDRSSLYCGWETVTDSEFPMARVEWQGLHGVGGQLAQGEDAQTVISHAGNLKVGDQVASSYASMGPDFRHDVEYYTPAFDGWQKASD